MLREGSVSKFVRSSVADCRACRSPIRRRSPAWRRSTARPAASFDRRRDARIPALHRSEARTDRARRGLCEGAGDVPHHVQPRLGILGHADAGPRHGGSSLAGPRRPHDRVPLTHSKKVWLEALPELRAAAKSKETPRAGCAPDSRADVEIGDGAVVVAAIVVYQHLNPSVLIGAGLLARNAVARGLTVEALGEDDLAPGSGRHGLPTRVETLRPRSAALSPRRLRLHDLHWQQRPLQPISKPSPTVTSWWLPCSPEIAISKGAFSHSAGQLSGESSARRRVRWWARWTWT